MRHILRAWLLVGIAASCVFAQGVPQLPFQSVPDPLTLPNDIHFGEVAGVAVNSKGHIFDWRVQKLVTKGSGTRYLNFEQHLEP